MRSKNSFADSLLEFSSQGYPGAGGLQCSSGLGDNVLMCALAIALLDIPQDLVFLAGGDETLQDADGEKLRFEQHDIRIVGASVSVIRSAQKCVGLPILRLGRW
ncbi:hypothetical protein LshimejAT787_0102250 [Lyophyllum shimeji]|uniref:Uncharacterized protein n=1 Tax=Lyophyllum shimeji TaxID=47721 RepID=A0A9P3UJH6_LYOSH|nr:hypothetical protein LshimejAT787_0102250 [Lyophyllum shimeji]